MKTPRTQQPADGRSELFEPGSYSSIPNVLMRRLDLTASAKLVWAALASHLGPTASEVWPSIARLAFLTGTNRETVLHAIFALEDHGLLKVHRAFGVASRYRILQPEAPLFEPERPGKTSRKTRPVGKSNQSEKPTQPVGKTDRNRSEKPTRSTPVSTPRSINPPTPRKKRGGGVCDLDPATEAVGEAYRQAVGLDMPSAWARRIRRESQNGSAAMLGLIDAAAVRSGLAMATRQGRTFGLGWVLKAVEARSAHQTAMRLAAQAAQATASGKPAAAAEAARAVQEAGRKNAAAAEAFAAMDAARRQRYLAAAAQQCRLVTREPMRSAVIAQTAALLAWEERCAHERTKA